MGIQVIRLTTIGRKSGEPRRVLLNAFPVGDNYAIVGSNLGDDSHPLWYLNLRANRTVRVDLAGSEFTAAARDTRGEERDRLWAEVIAADPSYAEYQERTERLIPIVVLERQIDGQS